MSFSTLQYLRSQLSNLEAKLKRYEKELAVQKKRRSDVETISNNIKGVCGYQYCSVNDYLNKIINNYDEAISGVLHVSELKQETTSDIEKDVSDDNNMNNALYQINLELLDIDNKIEDLKKNIAITEESIKEKKVAIRKEERNIAISYKNQYNRAQSKVNTADAACRAEPSNAKLKQEFYKACRERDSARNEYYKYIDWL